MIPLLIGAILAIASLWLPRDAIDPVARALIPAIALLATGIFPCMSLAVGAMKGDQRSKGQVDELYVQLHTVMRVLVATFALAALAISSIVGLVGLVSVDQPSSIARLGESALLIVICLFLTLLAGRVVAIGRAFFAILDINRKHALLVARAKTQGSRDETIERWRQERFAPDQLDEPTVLERT